MQKVAINGLGKIGRTAFKILMADSDLQLVAINDIVPAYQLAYLLNFDTVYGKPENRVSHDDFNLYVNGKQIRVLNTQDPAQLPWREMDIDIVLECSGKNTRREDLEKHIYAGAKQVLLAAPSQSEDIRTIVSGVSNHEENIEHRIISCASPAANCIAPIIEILGRRLGVKKSLITSLQPYNAEQSIVDAPATDLRKGRSGVSNFMPGYSNLIETTTKVIPQYRDKLSSVDIQLPISAGSMVDITLLVERHTSIEEVNNIFQQEAGSERYMGIVAVNFDPIVSTDILKDPRASVIDLTMTQVVDGDLVRIMSWYDNEYGFVNQILREAKRISKYEMILV